MRPQAQAQVEILYERYRTNVYVVAFNICKNAHDAEDVMQDTFIAYWQSDKEFESEEHVLAWLLRVAINKAKNKNLLFFRRKIVSLEEYMQTITFDSKESSRLFEAVMTLPTKYRIAVHLFYYEDYAIHEIADILGISESNVKVRLTRARKMLKETLKEEWEDE